MLSRSLASPGNDPRRGYPQSVPQPARHIRVCDVYEIAGGSVLDVYRVVKTATQGAPELADSFRSHYELGGPPRKMEVGWAVIYMGLSCWRTPAAAEALAQTFPKIGQYVAHVEL